MTAEFARVTGPSPAAMALKHELTQMILWSERHAPRSRQIAVGPSELGTGCERRLAYRIAGIPEVNIWKDPWPAIVGTAVHDWLERTVNNYQAKNGNQGWLTELRVYPDPLVKGRSDVFRYTDGTVVDWKTTGTDGMRKVHKGQIPEGYRVQIHTYGLGHRRAGREVNNVALVFLPRSGWLDDMYVHIEPYDESIALAGLERMYRIGMRLIELDVENNPHRFEQVDASPSDECVWCPFFNRELHADVSASEKGCPGPGRTGERKK